MIIAPMLNKERWKYTSLRGLDEFAYATPIPCEAPDVAIPSLPFETAGRLVFIDGYFVKRLSDFPEAITVNLIEAAFPEDNPFVKHLKPALSEGLGITVATRAAIDKPIDCIFLFTEQSKDCAIHLHHHIHMKAHSQASFVMRYVGMTDESYVTNAHTAIHCESGSNVVIYHFQQQGSKAYHVESVKAHQAENTDLAIHSLSLGALLARIDVAAHYDAAHAQSRVYGIYHVNGRQHVDYHLDAEHWHTHGTTAQHVKGCVDGQARAVFNGRVSVKTGAIKAVSEQSHHGLLLSKRARIDAKPELEIDCDDVQCRHGATVGSLRPDALFYLMSRGMSQPEAKAMLELAHVASLLSYVEVREIQSYMHDLLMAVALKPEMNHAG